jgi:membrane protein implicated in regulation of membrane protease activity
VAWVIWLAAAILLALVEVLSVDLIFLMLAGGALAAAVAAGLGAPVWAQVVTFGVVSTVLLVAVRPWALRAVRRSMPESATNVAAHVGRTAVVLLDVTAHAGRIKLTGEVWTARADDPNAVFSAGTLVRVVRIEGATAVVVAAGPADDPPSPD